MKNERERDEEESESEQETEQEEWDDECFTRALFSDRLSPP